MVEYDTECQENYHQSHKYNGYNQKLINGNNPHMMKRDNSNDAQYKFVPVSQGV